MTSIDGRVALSLNCGSSSLKFALFRQDGDVFETLIEGEAEAIGTPQSRLTVGAGRPGAVPKIGLETGPLQSHEAALALVFRLLDEQGVPSPAVIGHRIFHGGPSVRDHCLVDDRVLRAL